MVALFYGVSIVGNRQDKKEGAMDNMSFDRWRPRALSLTYRSYAHNLGQSVHPQALKIWRSQRRLLDVFGRYLPPEARLLELGSGNGKFADYLEAKQYQVRRTDPILEFVRYQCGQGREAEWYEVRHGVLDDHCYDGVLSMGLFQHFDDAQCDDVLQNVHRMLRPWGMLLVRVPIGYGAGFKSYYGNGYRYIRYRTPDLLTRALEETGFIVEEMICDDHWISCIASKYAR